MFHLFFWKFLNLPIPGVEVVDVVRCAVIFVVHFVAVVILVAVVIIDVAVLVV